MASSTERLAERLQAMEDRVTQVGRSPQLGNSSLENTSLKVKNAAGSTTMIIGQQFDGSAMAAVVNGPVPPIPAAPTVVGITGGYQVSWNGKFVDPQAGWTSPVVAPMDFARVDIHVDTTSGFTPSLATKVGEIVGPGGGMVTVGSTSTSASSTRYVKLVSVSEAGKSSAASVVTQVTHSGAAAVGSFRSGRADGGTDGNGLMYVAHGGGSTPTAWGGTPTNQSTDAINLVVSLLTWDADSNVIGFRVVRTDTNAYFAGNPISINWWASFA